jgi:hypothetical protein
MEDRDQRERRVAITYSFSRNSALLIEDRDKREMRVEIRRRTYSVVSLGTVFF